MRTVEVDDSSWREVAPDLPTTWTGRFIALYPDGSQSDYDLNGFPLSPGGELAHGYVLDHWERTVKPLAEGKPMLVGVLRRKTG